MTITTLSSREFNRDTAGAKKAAARGPVFITDRGEPAYALLRIEDYYRLAGQPETSLLLAMQAVPGGADVEFDPPRMDFKWRVPDFLAEDTAKPYSAEDRS